MGITLSYNGLGGKVKFSGTSGRFKTVYKKPLLLFLYPGAAVAYSLRRISSTYTGSAIRVRRSNDNAEQNIGFVNDVLDTVSLLTFTGANSAFVTTWYDQSGNANNLSSIFIANHVPIVASGVLYTQNGKPTLAFIGTAALDFTNTISSFNDLGIFLVQKANSAIQPGGLLSHTSAGGSGPAFGMGWSNNNQMTAFFGINGQMKIAFAAGANIGTNFNILNIIVNTTNFYPFVNNTAYTLAPANWTPSTTLFGRIGSYGGTYSNANVSEVIIYKTDQISNRTGINANINTYYSIY